MDLHNLLRFSLSRPVLYVVELIKGKEGVFTQQDSELKE